MSKHPVKSDQPEKDEVIHEVGKKMDSEDLWILKLTKKSAKLTLLIAFLFTADNLLPTSVYEEECIEFIFQRNELKKAKTESRTFTLAQEHVNPRQLGEGLLRIHVSPLLRQVKSYSLEAEGHNVVYFPFFSVYHYIFLMYLVLLFSVIQLAFPLTSFPRFGLWVFSIGCIFAYLLVYVSSAFQ
jgi:hypothetical protein